MVISFPGTNSKIASAAIVTAQQLKIPVTTIWKRLYSRYGVTGIKNLPEDVRADIFIWLAAGAPIGRYTPNVEAPRGQGAPGASEAPAGMVRLAFDRYVTIEQAREVMLILTD